MSLLQENLVTVDIRSYFIGCEYIVSNEQMTAEPGMASESEIRNRCWEGQALSHCSFPLLASSFGVGTI